MCANQPYQPFWKVKYQIVGIYRFAGTQAVYSNSSETGRDEVIIPAKSVKAPDENNIVDYGPMQSGTASFQIPNGSISEFEEAFRKLPESAFLQHFQLIMQVGLYFFPLPPPSAGEKYIIFRKLK